MTRMRHLAPYGAVLAAVGAIVGLAFLVMRTGDVNSAGGGSDPHARVDVSPDEQQAVLNAVDAATSSESEAELVATGRELFRSNTLAKSGESCQGCHTDGGANADLGNTPHSGAGDDFIGQRDPPALWAVGETAPYFWIGDQPTLEGTALATVKNHFLDGDDALIDAIGMTNVEVAAALTAYMRTLEAPESDFSQGTMSESARRGLLLFQGKAGCIGCHFGPSLTDNRLHDILVPQVQVPATVTNPAAAPTDPPVLSTDPGARKPPAAGEDPSYPIGTFPNGINQGRCPIPLHLLPVPPAPAADPLWCTFNTPGLLGVSKTAPYMHNGKFATLAEVVEFYATQSVISPLPLSPGEKADVVEFLKSL